MNAPSKFEDWPRDEREFGRWFRFVAVATVLWLAFLVWAVVQLVQWVTSK